MHANSGPPITQQEVNEAMKGTKPRKTPGTDRITSEVIKAGGEEMEKMLIKIFNMVWDGENPPKEWSKMLVTLIHKKENKLEPGNYRAISLLSIPGKVFSKVLLNRIKTKTE